MRLPLLLAALALTISSHWVDEQLSAAITTENDDLLSTLEKIRDFSLPNFGGCEHTKACYGDLLQSVGFSIDDFPSYDDYLNKMSKSYANGASLNQYCGTFDAVQRCFSQETDSCRTPTVFAVLFNITSNDAYRFVADLDLRKIMCDNQQELQDACIPVTIPKTSNAAESCDIPASIAGCSDQVNSALCQVNSKTKEIATLGACDGKIPKCWTSFHSCDQMNQCFDDFYAGVQKAGVKDVMPVYSKYASEMKSVFEKAAGIDSMCRLQEVLHACLLRHVNKNCPRNAQSFRKMYNLNYEQAYSYATDFDLRKAQCINRDGMKKNSCITDAKHLLGICTPYIPHNLTLGRSCTDLRLAMKCNNFVARQYCDEEARKAYCVTTEIIYQQGALGFCDGWMPSCEDPFASTTSAPSTSSVPTVATTTTTKKVDPSTSTRPVVDSSSTTVPSSSSTTVKTTTTQTTTTTTTPATTTSSTSSQLVLASVALVAIFA